VKLYVTYRTFRAHIILTVFFPLHFWDLILQLLYNYHIAMDNMTLKLVVNGIKGSDHSDDVISPNTYLAVLTLVQFLFLQDLYYYGLELVGFSIIDIGLFRSNISIFTVCELWLKYRYLIVL